jgi:hypothetical protein
VLYSLICSGDKNFVCDMRKRLFGFGSKGNDF